MHFIGVYDYTVVLTYLNLLSAVFGMTRAIHGDYKMAILCLAFCGVCDAFDGRVARTKKNRTEEEKNFGIQLDSLCDIVCFGVFPALTCYLLGVRGSLGLVIVFFYCICAVSRLAFFNALETKRQQTEGGCNKSYRGLPVTAISVILPMAFWLQFVMSELAFLVLLHVLLVLMGFLYILDFQVPKPDLKMIIIMMSIVVGTVVIIFLYTKFRIPDHTDESNRILGKIFEGIHGTKAS